MSEKLSKIYGVVPFVAVTFLNAFTDLGHKILIQNSVYKVYSEHTLIVLTTIVNALILLPFILLFTPSGYLADRYAKNLILRYGAWFAVAITLGITFSYYMGWFWVAFFFTFLLALQSALYSPAKYGYIKELVGASRLTQGNALIQASTIVAILSGIFVYTILFELSLPSVQTSDMPTIMRSIAPLGWLLVLGSLVEALLSYKLPKLEQEAATLRFDKQKYLKGGYLKENLSLVYKNKFIWFSIIGLSLFWAISQVVLATFPAYAKTYIGELNTIYVQGAMALSGVGIVIGSLLAGRLSKNSIETGIVPIGALGIAFSTFLITLLDSLFWEALNFLAFGIFAGLLIVPLNALMQFHAKEHEMGRILAGNNFIQNIFMFGFLMLTLFFALIDFDSIKILLLIGVLSLVLLYLALSKLPQAFFRLLAYFLVSRRYDVQAINPKNIPFEGGVLLLGNHVSFIDWAIIAMASHRSVHFIMERAIYEKRAIKWFVDMFDVIPVSAQGSKEAIKEVRNRLSKNEVVCVFPEGAISRNSNLGEFQRGFELMIKDTDAVIVPFYLRGLWGSRFSRASGKVRMNTRTGGKREVVVAFGEPMPGNSKRDAVKQKVFELSFATWRSYAQTLKPIHSSWLRMAKRLGGDLSVADTLGTKLSHTKMITATLLFSKAIAKRSKEEYIGLLLPTAAGGMIANMAVLTLGKIVCNLNYTAGEKAIRNAIKKADIKSIYTSRLFVDRLKERGLEVENLSDCVTIYYLEDIKAEFSKARSLMMLLQARLLPFWLLHAIHLKSKDINDTAAILFSSGSEGEPKGVKLSHKNIMVNLKQITDILNSEDEDVIMSVLPLFHAMGLTIDMFKPLVEGMPVVCHPDPTDAESIGKAVAQYEATILIATSTFYRIYCRSKKVLPAMFASLRFVVAGGEKLSLDVRNEFREKFKKEMYEGYGVTETSPVSGVNLPDKVDPVYMTVQVGQKIGTVGLPLPGTAYKIVDPDSFKELPIGEDGLILIGGEQVMQGYLKDEERTKKAIIEREGLRWYATGDKGHLDSDGFLTIVDRYSRFAKLGGEMVSLTSLEDEVRAVINNSDIDLIATALPDAKKGEKVILLVAGDIDVKHLRQQIVEAGINPLSIPAKIYKIDAVPKLGSGKNDFATTKKLAQELEDAS